MTLYFYGDAEQSNASGVAEEIKDFNAAVALSPTGNIAACFGMGDMTKDTSTMQLCIDALNGSSLKDVPSYWAIGNHEYNSRSVSYPLIQGKLGKQYPLSYFTTDTTKNTYSMTINGIHIAVLNIYHNNSTGKVSQAMFDWLSADMAAYTGYKVVICHDPLYPLKKHVGDSLDSDKAMRDKLQAMFIANKVNVFLGGHTHYSSVQNIGGVFHVCTGVVGPGTGQGEDPFASLNYIYVDEKGDLRLVRKQDSGNSWANPKVITHTIGTGGSIPPDPVETWSCRIPLDGMEVSNLGNVRPNPDCDPVVTGEKWGWKESGQLGVAGECVLNPNGKWSSKEACVAAHPPRVKWTGTECISVGHLHEPDMFDTMEACLLAHPQAGEFDLSDLAKVEAVLKTISDALDSIRKK